MYFGSKVLCLVCLSLLLLACTTTGRAPDYSSKAYLDLYKGGQH